VFELNFQNLCRNIIFFDEASNIQFEKQAIESSLAVGLGFGQKLKPDPWVGQIRQPNPRIGQLEFKETELVTYKFLELVRTKTIVQTRKLDRNFCSTRGLDQVGLFNMPETQPCGHANREKTTS
jgi:hypothetical protein